MSPNRQSLRKWVATSTGAHAMCGMLLVLQPFGCSPDSSSVGGQTSGIPSSAATSEQPQASASVPVTAAPRVLGSGTDLELITDVFSDGAQLYFAGGRRRSDAPGAPPAEVGS